MKKRSPTKARGITLKDVLAHIQAMRNDLAGRMGKLEVRMDRLEGRIDKLETAVVSLKRQIDVIHVGVGNIDKGVDELEVVEIPQINKAVGIR